ncbi:putative membrane protein YhfC [Bacteroidia bacterium]|nr:putative membrane protein YhfC [Bacteroidia bacterium]
MHVPILSIVFMAISALISVGVPAALLIYWRKKYKTPLVPAFVGVVAFIVFALLLERGVHYVVLSRYHLIEKPLLYMAYGALMAGIFEETARWLSFQWLKRKYNSIGTGLSYGIGHGGAEAFLLVGLAMMSNIAISAVINTDNTALLDKMHLPAETMALFFSTEPILFLVSGMERIFAIAVQISLSVLVFHAVVSGKKWLFPLAILLHALVDAPAALMQAGAITNVWVVEGIVLACAVLLVCLAVNVHKKITFANNY